ncbi:Uncharacterised protein [Mycobacteroides abscessus subsp. abscessus]|nr:Uncharacterised protein [Mycobacteroides abscessus subsp. abscessus]
MSHWRQRRVSLPRESTTNRLPSAVEMMSMSWSNVACAADAKVRPQTRLPPAVRIETS